MPESQSKILMTFGQTSGSGTVNEATNTERRIESKANQILGSVRDLQLQQIIRQIADIADVREHIADCRPDWSGRYFLITCCGRTRDVFVQIIVKRKDSAIHWLKWIFRLAVFVRWRNRT